MDMRPFFFPRSIAVFGVSDAPTNLGRTIIENCDRFGFKGPIYPVGRAGTKQVAGRRLYAHVKDVPEVPELAVFLIPARHVPDALQACSDKGIRHVVIETGGFSELGEEGKTLENRVLRIAREGGITFMGPNCVGVLNVESGVCMPFVPFSTDEIVKGTNAFISQSGGLVHELMRASAVENVGLTKLVSIGNKLIVDENDVLDFYINDPGTSAIGMYLESVKDGRRLMQLAAGSSKPIVILKGNTNPGSREIAQFHTSALLGDDAVADAAFRQAGMHRVQSLQEMIECFKIFALPLLKGRNLFILSRSGGQTVVMADLAYRYGFRLPDLPSGLRRLVRKQVKAGVIRSTNPLDLGDVFNDIFYLELVEAALKEKQGDGVIFFYDYAFGHTVVYDIVKGAEELSRKYGKPVTLCVIPEKDHWFSLKYSRPFPYFADVNRVFSALRRSLDQHEKTGRVRKRMFSERVGIKRARPSRVHPRIATPQETFSLLTAYGVPFADYRLVRTPAETLEGARALGYPVVLKRMEPFELHKTEAGGVRLNIGTDRDLKKALDAMPGNLYLLQKMVAGGVDTIIGGKNDPEFGPVVMFGLGGIFVEVLKDVTMRVAPIDTKIAREMVGEIKGAPLLKGVRGTTPADVESLSDVLARVSKLLVQHPEITSLDINPLRVFGEGCLALDVKIELSE